MKCNRLHTLLILPVIVAVYGCAVMHRGYSFHNLSPLALDSISKKYATTSIDPTQMLDPAGVRTDLNILKQVLEEAQTSIYTYSSERKVNKAFARALNRAADSLTYLELIRAIAQVQYTIACGHSSWEHSPAYLSYREKYIRLFPMDIAIVDGRYYIKKNLSMQTGITDFTRITHINGKPVSQITMTLKKYMNRDGFSNPDNTIDIEQSFKWAYSNFIGNPEVFTLKTADGKQHAVQPLLPSEIDSIKTARYGKEKPQRPLHLSVCDSLHTATYTIARFSNEIIRSMGQEFVPFTDSVFAVLNDKKTSRLIIDLRGNRGGWTANGVHLLSYFIDKPVPYIKRVELKRHAGFSFTKLVTEDAGYDSTMLLSFTGKYYEWKNNPNLIAYPAERNRFKGTVFILVDGFTRSASSVFCALAKEHTDAVIVGEELAAAHCGTSGMVMGIRLPYSGIGIKFSTARYHFSITDSSDMRGIKPHIRIRPDLGHARGEKDMYMEQVLTLPR